MDNILSCVQSIHFSVDAARMEHRVPARYYHLRLSLFVYLEVEGGAHSVQDTARVAVV